MVKGRKMKAFLIDITKCIGCGACTQACQQINDLPVEKDPAKLSSTVWTTVQHRDGLNVKRQCMHCEDPACASVCPVKALHKTPEGPVVYDASRCIGCRYCMVACPFSIPTYEWDKPLPKVQKCIMCYEKRVSKGLPPACASVCPTGATKFGERDDLVAEARQRIANDPKRYVNHIYGLEEAGGTSVLYLSPVPFEELGLPTNLLDTPYPQETWNILTKIPNIVSVGAVLMVGIHWVVNRRMMIERMERENSSQIRQIDTTTRPDSKSEGSDDNE